MKTDKAKGKIKYAINKIEEYLRQENRAYFIPDEQLVKMKKMLNIYLENIENNTIKPDYGIGHHIVDNWTRGTGLSEYIIDAEDEYSKLFRR